jgi:8-oxo-dGTP pyrophosphatase MutT (NUDIX family)
MTDHFHQTIPRPKDVVVLSGTPWSVLTEAQRSKVTLDDVAQAFAVVDVHLLDPGPSKAAVLIGLIEGEGGAELLLTRRALHLLRDPGLMSFPGGYVEEGELPVDAALREAYEEIALEPHHVAIRSCFGTIERPRSGIAVIGYLGFVDSAASMRASPGEVHEIHRVPLVELLKDGAGWQEDWTLDGTHRTLSFFASEHSLGDNLVWGLTAAYIWQLLVGVTEVLAKS